jgi:hemoglobin-like flavoprotein
MSDLNVPEPDAGTSGRVMYAWEPPRNIVGGEPVPKRTGIPQPIVNSIGEVCPTCGHKMPGIKELLEESAGWIDNLDGVVVAFYNQMLDMAHSDAVELALAQGKSAEQAELDGQDAVADLAYLFPSDLLTAAEGEDSRGAGQRDKLAKALVALATTFDPGNEDKMTRLDNVIKSMGHRHAAFERRNGTIQGATLGEYNLAKRALFAVLGTLGDRLTAAHVEAWSQAYDYAAAGMMQVQIRSGASAPRFSPNHGQ